MADYGSKITDKAIAEVMKKLRKIYEQASKELNRKMKLFTARHQAKQKKMLEQLAKGEITKAAYESWMRGQVFIGERWKKKIDQLARLIGKKNKTAYQIIQKIRIHVFSENHNHSAYETEVQTGISFDIYNETAVEKLIKEDPTMLPEWKIDEEKDYIWNRQKVENAVTQGIIQGESVDQIADRLAKELSSTNMNKMRLFARTAMVGAQNAGVQKQMEEAEKQGIEMEKRWLATLDNRTRDTHQELDGQQVAVKDSFKVKVKGKTEAIRYPGDPSAIPCLVYNCRCTMISVLKGVDRKTVRRAYEEDENGYRKSYIVEGLTYKEWLKRKGAGT